MEQPPTYALTGLSTSNAEDTCFITLRNVVIRLSQVKNHLFYVGFKFHFLFKTTILIAIFYSNLWISNLYTYIQYLKLILVVI